MVCAQMRKLLFHGFVYFVSLFHMYTLLCFIVGHIYRSNKHTTVKKSENVLHCEFIDGKLVGEREVESYETEVGAYAQLCSLLFMV